MAQVLSALLSTSLMFFIALGIGLCVAYIFREWLNKL